VREAGLGNVMNNERRKIGEVGRNSIIRAAKRRGRRKWINENEMKTSAKVEFTLPYSRKAEWSMAA